VSLQGLRKRFVAYGGSLPCGQDHDVKSTKGGQLRLVLPETFPDHSLYSVSAVGLATIPAGHRHSQATVFHAVSPVQDAKTAVAYLHGPGKHKVKICFCA